MLSGLSATAGASSANGTLLGAGSTLIAPLMNDWIADFGDKDGIGITYGAVGSGAGISQITARTVDFGASDAPLSSAQARACNGCVQIPWALSATGIAFNVPGVSYLRVTGPILAAIYTGQIKMWNDPQLVKINPNSHLPALAITPVYRSDGSGDTYAFTDYLSKVSPSWKSQIGFGTAVSFPTGVGGKGNAGVQAVVSSTSGAIGYLSASYIIAARNLSAAAVENAGHKYELPNLKNISAAAAEVKSVPASNELHIVDPHAKYKTAYPISTFTYVIVPQVTPNAKNLSKFIEYALTTGAPFGLALDFPPVPKVVRTAAFKTVATLTT
ncbi:MAG TPA: phosphate ABC transporter substrate-binding protein PstS [Solirubrobacteraceae bacterium]|jgi:phosphate transport system substrate-binding protein|nr:phosphate ABC transporter substrate-binding protein PstS [Solirubrobacteraceae bacterium]